MADALMVERDGGVAVLTLNRPRVLNAMDSPAWRALNGALDRPQAFRGRRPGVRSGGGVRTGALVRPHRGRGGGPVWLPRGDGGAHHHQRRHLLLAPPRRAGPGEGAGVPGGPGGCRGVPADGPGEPGGAGRRGAGGGSGDGADHRPPRTPLRAVSQGGHQSGGGGGPGTALAFEAELAVLSLLSEDHREGARAFLEKREARFVGR